MSYVYTNNRLAGIDTSSTEYSIEYNAFGRISVVFAGMFTLANYTYAPNNGKLTKLTYGNGDYEEYIYDYLDRLVSVKYNGVVKYSIEIDANNRLYSLTENGNTHYYEYDSIGRLIRGWQEDENGNSVLEVENTYDESGVAGFEYDGVNYYFVKNIQGDVIEICSWNGGSVVQYT